jgi:hypothetical protein
MPSFSRADYESLLYSLADRYPVVVSSTLRLYTNSATTALVRGSIRFASQLELRVFEYPDLTNGQLLAYSYTVLRGDERIRWYDPQPHPEVPELASTFPHHRQEPPDIKHNRRPAPSISFEAPNLPVLIADCIELGNSLALPAGPQHSPARRSDIRHNESALWSRARLVVRCTEERLQPITPRPERWQVSRLAGLSRQSLGGG